MHLFISQDGWGALTWAAYRGHANIVKHLLEWEANPNETGQVNETCFMLILPVLGEEWKMSSAFQIIRFFTEEI